MPDIPSKQETEYSKESIKKEQPDGSPLTECGCDTRVGERCLSLCCSTKYSNQNTPYSSIGVLQRNTDSHSECFQENGHIWNPCFQQQQRVHYITVPCIVNKDSSKVSGDFTRIEHNRLYYTPQTYVDHHREINIKKEEQQPDKLLEKQVRVRISEYNSTTHKYIDDSDTDDDNGDDDANDEDDDEDEDDDNDDDDDDSDIEGMSLVIDQNEGATSVSIEYNKSPSSTNGSVYGNECSILQLDSDTQVVKKNRGGGKVGRRRRRTYVYNPKPLVSKPKAVPIKDDKGLEYWSKRMRNNDAAKRSRENRRVKEIETLANVTKLGEQNEELKAKIDDLENKNKYLESLLCKGSGNQNS